MSDRNPPKNITGGKSDDPSWYRYAKSGAFSRFRNSTMSKNPFFVIALLTKYAK
jgi:hypothetical protein